MADLEKLTVLLEAQTKQFDAAMKRVARLTDDTANKATRSLSRLDKALARTNSAAASFMKSFALGAIGGLGIERIASGIGQAVKQMAELADEAKRAGMSAEDIQAIGFGAMQAGSSTEELVDLMKKFNVEVGEAATKSNDLAKLFEANGVALRNQDGTLRSTKDLFYEITNLIANAKSQQEAATIAQMAFGRAAGDALPFLQQGAEAIKESEKAARDVGAVISNEIIAKADEFDDRWAVTWARFGANAKSGIGEAIFALEEWNNRAVKAVSDFFGTTPVNMFPSGSGANVSQFDLMMQSANKPAGKKTIIPTDDDEKKHKFIKSANEINLTVEKMSAEVEAAQDAFVDFFSAISSGAKPIDALRSSLMRLGDSLLRMGLMKGFELLLGALMGPGAMPPGVGPGGMGFTHFGGPRAGGGAIQAGKGYLVGEEGPEYIVPDRSGYVVPNSRMGGMGGGAPVINISNPVGVQASASASRRDGQWVVDIVTSMIDSTFPGNMQKYAPVIGAKPASRRTS